MPSKLGTWNGKTQLIYETDSYLPELDKNASLPAIDTDTAYLYCSYFNPSLKENHMEKVIKKKNCIE